MVDMVDILSQAVRNETSSKGASGGIYGDIARLDKAIAGFVGGPALVSQVGATLDAPQSASAGSYVHATDAAHLINRAMGQAIMNGASTVLNEDKAIVGAVAAGMNVISREVGATLGIVGGEEVSVAPKPAVQAAVNGKGLQR